MKKYDDGLCSFQEYKEFVTRLYDAVDEWINYCDSDPEMGIALEQGTLEIEIMNKREYDEICFRNTRSNNDVNFTEICNKEVKYREWFPLEQLVKDGVDDDDAIIDLADQICFVR